MGLLHTISLTSRQYGVPIDGLKALITEKETHAESLENRIITLEEKYSQMLQRNNVTEGELEQIRTDRPLVEKIKELRDKLNERSTEKIRIVKRVVLSEVPSGKTYHGIFEASKLLLYNSSQLEEEIDSILEKRPHLPNKLGQEDIDELQK